MKIQMKTAGIEPATFRFVVQHLNHCATAVPRVETRSQCIIYDKLVVFDGNFLILIIPIHISEWHLYKKKKKLNGKIYSY